MAFLRALGLNKAARNIYQPKPRAAPYSSAVKGRCVVFAGRTDDFLKLSKKELSSTVEVFDLYLEQWRVLKTTGSPPKGLFHGACCSTPNGELYVYGGYDGSSYYGGLYKLAMSSQELKWSQLSVESDLNGPMRKAGSRMVCFDNKKLAVIGGKGIPHGPPQPGSRFRESKRYTDGSGYTNEIHFYDIEECTWSSPSFSGTRPPPCYGFSLTSINDHQALLYGGGDAELRSTVSDLYLIDFQTMVITKLQRLERDPWPVERASHATCCLGFGSERPQLLVTGGVNNDNKTLKNAWLFDMSSRKWNELPLPEGVLPRYWHSTVAVDLAPGLTEVTVFAGCPQYDPKKTEADQVKLAETVILSFEFVSHSEGGSCTNEWKLVDVANNSQRGSDERVKEKMEKIKQFAREAARRDVVAELGVSLEDRDEVQRLKEALQETQVANLREREQAEAREKELQGQLEAIQAAEQEKEHTIKDVERRMEDAERRMEEVTQAARERENELQQDIQRAERDREETQQLMEKAEKSKEDAARKMEEVIQIAEREREQIEREIKIAQNEKKRAEEAEAEAREVRTQWVVRRREIQLTNVKLGRGGWGAVMVAHFRGIQVAAKCLHEDLISNYYQDMFNREMNMAARLRHPNLVQFIGVSIEGHPIILTELMKTSLRAELKNGSIKLPHVTSISVDVVRALNYLHLMQPHPIIHRDISSANVLLDPLPDNKWKAKVSDYGSVNLQQQLNTENPGSPVYSAPEANIPALQSPMMDIFSFGVLLVEMLTGRFPQVSSRQRLIASIDHAGYLALIQQCMSEDRDRRPSAQQLLASLCDIIA